MMFFSLRGLILLAILGLLVLRIVSRMQRNKSGSLFRPRPTGSPSGGFCVHCGAPLASVGQFCGSCGAPRA